MPSRCTVCTHDKRTEIDDLILRGEPVRNIALQYGVSFGAIQRHKKHIKSVILEAKEKKGEEIVQRGLNLRKEFDDLLQTAKDELEKADKARDRAAWHDQVLKMLKMAHSIGMSEARKNENQEKEIPEGIKRIIEEAINDADVIDGAIDDRQLPDTPAGE